MSSKADSLHPLGISAASVPWYVWCGVIAVTSASIGGAWDVSWHRSIGRDSFWTPAHMAIYACGVLAAVFCAYLIFATTFGSSTYLKRISVIRSITEPSDNLESSRVFTSSESSSVTEYACRSSAIVR